MIKNNTYFFSKKFRKDLLKCEKELEKALQQGKGAYCSFSCEYVFGAIKVVRRIAKCLYTRSTLQAFLRAIHPVIENDVLQAGESSRLPAGRCVRQALWDFYNQGEQGDLEKVKRVACD